VTSSFLPVWYSATVFSYKPDKNRTNIILLRAASLASLMCPTFGFPWICCSAFVCPIPGIPRLYPWHRCTLATPWNSMECVCKLLLLHILFTVTAVQQVTAYVFKIINQLYNYLSLSTSFFYFCKSSSTSFDQF
jgi:hypothetical protein